MKRVLIALLFAWLDLSAAEPDGLLRDFDQAPLLIESSAGCILIESWVASRPAQLRQGLMHIRRLGSHEGMIFLYGNPRPVSMWMKNTYIPLDMLFLDADGRVQHLHRNAIPHDETTIRSPVPVNAVVELNAGSIDRFGIEQGTRIRFPFR